MGNRGAAAAIFTSLLLLGACGGATDSSSPSPTEATGTTSSATSSTTTVATQTRAAPTTQTPTTQAVTTTSEALPVPAPPPAPRAVEPRVELGILEIPKLGVSKTLFEGVSLNTLDNGPGHWPGTAMPGHIGNVVIGGHRTTKDRPFRDIDQLLPGDEVILSTLEGRFVYRVNRTEIVTPESLWIIDQTPAFTATLFACHPVGSTRERIIVFLDLDDNA